MIKLGVLPLALASLALAAESPADKVRHVLDDQVTAWNRGDLVTFVETYRDSKDIAFVGSDITRGRAQLLEHYRQRYNTPAKMGHLSFSDLEVRLLGTGFANVLGRFHLTRAAESGGDASGVFTLLLQKTPQGWKIIQDHTS